MPHISAIHILIMVGIIGAVAAVARIAFAMIRPPDAPESTAFTQYRAVVRKFLIAGFGIPIAAYLAAIAASFISAAQATSIAAADGWAAITATLGAVGMFGLVLFPLLALIASERVVRRFEVPVATLAARSVTTLVKPAILAVAGIVGAAGIAAVVGAMLINHSGTEFAGRRNTIDSWGALVLLLAAATLSLITIRLAISRGDLDATDASDRWTRSGVATRAVALFVAGACLASLIASGAFTNAVFSHQNTGQWWEFAHVLGVINLLQVTFFLVFVVALVMVAKPPVTVPRTAVRA